jgi:cell wall-associated NlpC family hydrolase
VLPAGSYLISDDHGYHLVGKRVSPIDDDSVGDKPSSMNEVALQFLGAPYHWGGRTVLGVDCSGLVQTAARLVGTRLLRDASEQAEVGEIVEWEERGVDDLAFFKNEDGKITHVGILTSRDLIVHASGEVRVDILSEEGIIHSNSAELTHTLSHLRRLVELRSGN